MKHSTLVVLAGGLGSRFGGNKQISCVGPSGECLMEYSIHDAVEAGFKVTDICLDTLCNEINYFSR